MTRSAWAVLMVTWVLCPCCFAGTVAPAAAEEQPTPLDQPGVVSMAIKEASILVLVETIAVNGRYNFVCQGKSSETASVNMRDLSIRDALDGATRGSGLEYRIVGNVVTLFGHGANSNYVQVYDLPTGRVDERGDPADVVKALVLRESQAPETQAFVIVASARHRLIVNTRPSVHRAIAAVLAAIGQAPRDRK